MSSRQFNALAGSELKAKLLSELDQHMATDPRFSPSSPATFRELRLNYRVDFECYPNQPAIWNMQVVQTIAAPQGAMLRVADVPRLILDVVRRYFDADERFGLHLTYPKITWTWNLPLEFVSMQGMTRAAEVTRAMDPRTDPTAVPGRENVVDLTRLRAVAPRQEPIPAPNGGSTERVAELERTIAAMREQLLHLTSGAASTAVSSEADQPIRLSPSEVSQRHIDSRTGTGLQIVAGFEASPGADLALSHGGGSHVGVAAGVGADEVTRMELGAGHPGLEQGGAGSPDALRRSAGLPVPQRQATPSGMLVDVPLGSF